VVELLLIVGSCIRGMVEKLDVIACQSTYFCLCSHSDSYSTGLRSVPILLIVISTVFPGLRNCGGFMAKPTPSLELARVLVTLDELLAFWCSSHNHSAFLQRCPLAEIADQIRTIEQQIRNFCVLSHFSVYPCGQMQ